MQFKNNTKQRNQTIQGLRSFKDTLPKNIKKIIKKKGHIFSETLNNWKYIVGDRLFKVCYPKSFKNSNRLSLSTLLIMVKRGHEVDLEYSKKNILDKMNNFFGYPVVEKLKFVNFDVSQKSADKSIDFKDSVTINKYTTKIENIRNEKIKKSLIELTKNFKKK
tara:strand:+ start:135 stop:623 length:489 start_codon:yes stop_codon:yes gene_type:complete